MLGNGNFASLIGLLFLTLSSHFVASQDQCAVENPDKVDCGKMGSTQQSCESDGCCWKPIEPNPDNYPWCYYTSAYEDPCDSFVWTASGPGFDDAIYDIMYQKYLSQLNVEGSGAVVAAPDQETPGGSYYYHWMRDAGLSIKAWLDINNNDYDKVKLEVGKYAEWVEKVQHMPDPLVDVRVEPKFYIPDGRPYDGGWCRPQTDGPALRAMAMSKWGMLLSKAGQGDPDHIWSLVQFDLAWVLENWQSEGCDLWEEVRSTDFYFNRMAYVYSLNVAADFGEMVGDSATAGKYRQLAETIKPTAAAHWKPDDGYIYESTNRPFDGAVLHSIATFGEHLYPAESQEAASTIKFLAKKFCREYPINKADIQAGKPGVLIGRYPGDSYAGGNPWQLLTAVTAEVFYLGGQATLKQIKENGNHALDLEANRAWMELLDLKPGTTASQFAIAQIEAGDAVMTALYDRVKNDGGRIDEQIDKNTGAQASAASLTWSYANVLHALHVRKSVVQQRTEIIGF